MTGQVVPRPKTRGKTPTAATLKRKADRLWGEYIHRRDQQCRFCGKRDGKLDAHHICIRSFAATRTDEQNGLLLCWPTCHQNVAHGDPFRAVLLYTDILGADAYAALRAKAQAGVKANAMHWRAEVARLTALLSELEVTP